MSLYIAPQEPEKLHVKEVVPGTLVVFVEGTAVNRLDEANVKHELLDGIEAVETHDGSERVILRRTTKEPLVRMFQADELSPFEELVVVHTGEPLAGGDPFVASHATDEDAPIDVIASPGDLSGGPAAGGDE
jgi:hypothetical protein